MWPVAFNWTLSLEDRMDAVIITLGVFFIFITALVVIFSPAENDNREPWNVEPKSHV